MAQAVAVSLDVYDRSGHSAVRTWLLAIAALILAMVAVGGATRLTDSGLSITEWQPLLGVIPPLNALDWQMAFDKYKQIPEYKLINQGMSLAEFKFIFWWEWGHRFLGRLIGVAFAVPLLVFWLAGMIPHGYRMPLLVLLALGGLQGFIGWYMVQSGLTERVDVSHYRLALHLCIAFFILGLTLWIWADLGKDKVIYLKNLPSATGAIAVSLSCLIFLQVALGAFVAGTKAGLVYNTWPSMDGQLIPAGLYVAEDWVKAMFEDRLTIQFNHRIMAYILVVLAIVQSFRLIGIDNDRIKHTAHVLTVLTIAQASLGIWTLLAAEGAIPIGLGIMHQTLAAIVFAASVLHMHAIQRAYR